MSGFIIDLSNVREFSNLSAFPNGWYAARVVKGETGLDDDANPRLEFTFEIFSEQHGSATISQRITQKQDFIMLPLWLAVNDMTREEFDAMDEEARKNVRVDPDSLVDGEILLHLGERKGNKPKPDGTYPIYKNITSPFFAPISRWSELNDAGLIQ